jgi:hypothetical protein
VKDKEKLSVAQASCLHQVIVSEIPVPKIPIPDIPMIEEQTLFILLDRP